MAFCTTCGARIPEGSKFCTECGAPAPEEKKPRAPAPAAAETAPPAPAEPRMPEPQPIPVEPVTSGPAPKPQPPVPPEPPVPPVPPAPPVPPVPPAPPAGTVKKGGKKTAVIVSVVAAVVIIAGALLAFFLLRGGDAPGMGRYEAVSCNGMELNAGQEWLELKGKGKARLHLMGVDFDLEWTLDGENLTLIQYETHYTGTLKDGAVVLDINGVEYVFLAEGAEKPRSEDAAGYWTLLYCDGGGDPDMALTEDDVKDMKELGLELYAVLKPGGDGTVCLGAEAPVRWGQGTIEVLGDTPGTIGYTLKGEQLHLDLDGIIFVMVRGQGEGPVPEPTEDPTEETTSEPTQEPDPPETTTPADQYSWWNQDWYGWVGIPEASGSFADWESSAWDVCGRIEVDGAEGTLKLWDDSCGENEYMAEANVTFRTGMTEKGMLISKDGWVITDQELEEGYWTVDPYDMYPADDMICLRGRLGGETEDDWMHYYIFLRPWGEDWENIRDMAIENSPYSDMMPMDYEEWYLPRIQRGETKAPATFDAEPETASGVLDYRDEGAILFTYPQNIFRFDDSYGFTKLKNEDNSLILKFDALDTDRDVTQTAESYDSNYGNLEEYEKQQMALGEYPATMICYRESGDYCLKMCIDLAGDSAIYAGMEITVYATEGWDQLVSDEVMETIISMKVIQ